MRFHDRVQAAWRLVEALRPLGLERPVILGIPRGGVVLADILARALGGTADVVFARKIGAPGHQEFALGAVGEDGSIYLQPYAHHYASPAYLEAEAQRQQAVIAERAKRYRAVRPKVALGGRDVVIVDDGIATGSTVEAAIQAVRAEQPRRLIVAVPVAPPEALERLQGQAEVVCLSTPVPFGAVGAFYQEFPQVSDQEVLERLSGWASL
ncbi:MAG: phosphoribosyl transferase [Meiothermus sp.]